MRVIYNLEQLDKADRGVVLTLGNFDGIHLGHRTILQKVVKLAAGLKADSAVFTFREHPLKLLAPEKAPPLLSTLEEKLLLLRGLGIRLVICLPFDRRIADTGPREFVRDIICSFLAPRLIIVGHDYAFGKNRAGNTEFLKRCGEEYGFAVQVVPAIEGNGNIVSSTVIRQKISQGQVRAAAGLLGRPYCLRSVVVPGKQRGKQLGCRTANLAPQPKLLPACGVYAARVQLNQNSYAAVANIGRQPTYGRNDLQVEVHLLDFAGDLYGRELEVAFISRLREERKFPDPAALRRQIEEDIRQARRILANEHNDKGDGLRR